MKATNNIELSIPKPCHENWAGMSATEKGKFCAVCQKEVIDYTNLSKDELVKAVAGKSDVCGRVLSTQLDVPVLKKSFIERRLSFTRKIAASFLAIVGLKMLSIGSADAQIIQLKNPSDNDLKKIGIEPRVSNNDSIIQISGLIKDPKTREAIPFAIVKIYQNGNLYTGAITDTGGVFSFNLPTKDIGTTFDLSITTIGYDSLAIKGIPVSCANFYMDLALNASPNKPEMIQIMAGAISSRSTLMEDNSSINHTTYSSNGMRELPLPPELIRR